MNSSRINNSSQTSPVETPRKRRRIENFDDEVADESSDGFATPQLRRRPPPMLPSPFEQSHLLPKLLRPPPPPQVAAIASKIEEKLAEVEIETRREIDALFNLFSTRILQTIAAAKKPSSSSTADNSQKN